MKLVSDLYASQGIEHGSGCKLNVVCSRFQPGLQIVCRENASNSDQADRVNLRLAIMVSRILTSSWHRSRIHMPPIPLVNPPNSEALPSVTAAEILFVVLRASI